MSDYADFVESYGYEVGDPDAFDKISSKWENDERDSNLKVKYEAGLAKGKVSPKKNYHNSKIKRFGFNNFKPYGDKVQSFSKKPITLIYGPNSIGKSSFIHINAYNNFIHKTQNFNLENTNMFGDEINLGGFSKFIHKRDKNNILKLEYEFEDCSEAIIDFLGLSSHSQFDLDALSKFSILDIEEIIRKSKYYTTEIFSELNQESLLGISTPETENVIESLKIKRKNNNLCLYVYPNESNFLRYIYDKEINSERLIDIFYKTVPYIHSNVYEEDEFDTKEYVDISLSDKKEPINLDNIDEKNYFISDVLIPYFINEAKLQYILENSSLYRFIDKLTELNSEAIKKIAEMTVSFISQLIEKNKVFTTLKESPIPLKIVGKIKDSEIFEVEYYVENKLFVRLEKRNNEFISSISDNNYQFLNNHLFEFELDEMKVQLNLKKLKWSNLKQKMSMTDYQLQFKYYCLKNKQYYIDNFNNQLPGVFQNLPEILFEKIYECYSSINHLHEKNDSILFLSFGKGYNNIIGAFNDMLGFNDMQYIGPLRFYPERDVSFKELDSDRSITPDSQASWSYLKNDEKLRKNINKWLKGPNKLKTPYEIKYRRLYDIENSFENLDFEILLEIKSKVQDIINNIEKYSITNEMSYDKQDHLVKKLSKESSISTNRDWLNFVSEKRDFVNNLIFHSSLSNKQKFQKILSESNILHNVEYKEELIFEDLRNGTQISNRDLGLGISQILPVLIATNHQKNTTIAIEQPELHLHPAVQCEIADEFIRSYKTNKNEFLIETHSEHLLLRIMKRMRQTNEGTLEDESLALTPDDVCILYVDNDGKQTYLQELRLSKKGKLLDHWPNGFFEEGYKERFS